MPRDRDFVPIIEPGPAHSTVVQPKSRHPNDMQGCPRGGAESGDVSGILRNLWLNKSDAEHRTRCKQIAEKAKRLSDDHDEFRARLQNNRNGVAWKAFAV